MGRFGLRRILIPRTHARALALATRCLHGVSARVFGPHLGSCFSGLLGDFGNPTVRLLIMPFARPRGRSDFAFLALLMTFGVPEVTADLLSKIEKLDGLTGSQLPELLLEQKALWALRYGELRAPGFLRGTHDIRLDLISRAGPAATHSRISHPRCSRPGETES